ncbi:DNA ligase D [Xanthomonas sp. WHRI 1810A]|uniref:DNA ligase D n=1 Tax=Xanthomonas sp. WHRI 1810A TaxID=3161565 RepID=UPI0032E86D22
MNKPVSEYARKRNFDVTSEPPEAAAPHKGDEAHALSFVIHKHDARNLHYDFRLELDGTLKSWAVPKGPSLDPKNKRLAVHVEDHPLGYGTFEGSIPEGEYGAGDVIVWDRGVWQPHGDPRQTYKDGKLKFTLIGEKLTGEWALVRTHLRGSGDKEQWLLIKEKDDAVRPEDEYDIVTDMPQSVVSGATVGEGRKPVTRKSARKPSAAKADTKAAPATKKKPAKSKTAIPEKLTPQLATRVESPPEGDWLYEIKFDGYRILTRIQDGEVRLFSRDGDDWTERLPLQAKALTAMKLGDGWLDGEMVVLNDAGLPDFQALEEAFEIGRSKDIVYYVFDAPFLDGEDLRNTAVEERRAAVKARLGKQRSRLLRFSDAFAAKPQDIIESARALSLDGVIGKRVGSAYDSTRSADWIELKCDEYPETPKAAKAPVKAKASKATAPAKGKKAASSRRVPKGKIEVAGVLISHPERVIDQESGLHKIDLAQFYESIADWILPHLVHRPVALLRCPDGVEGEQFFQKHCERLAIPNIKQLDPKLDTGHARLMEIDTVQALVGAAQMGTIELHTWGATADKIETPDHFVLDLDPDPALPWRSMIEATSMTLAVLDELGLEAFIKTSGGKGMHIIVPLARSADWDTVKAFAKAIAQFIADKLPERFTAVMGPKNRVGKIFIDFLRNTRGASTATAYSVRARPGLPVSVPITREELPTLTSASQWNISNLQARLRKLKADPWAGYKNKQRITKKMWKQLGAKAPE